MIRPRTPLPVGIALVFVTGALTILAGARARAFICIPGWSEAALETPLLGARVPTDAQPWFYRACTDDWSECTLRSENDEVNATFAWMATACPEYVRLGRLVPTRALIAGERYDVECDGFLLDDPTLVDAPHVTVRLSPARPPLVILAASGHRERREPICGGPLALMVTAELDETAGFFSDGGILEVAYADGSVAAIATPEGPWLLPDTADDFTLTPVAINGARGEPVVVDADEITEDYVYIPGCSVAPRGGAPWWMLVAAWSLRGRRRRSRKRGEP